MFLPTTGMVIGKYKGEGYRAASEGMFLGELVEQLAEDVLRQLQPVVARAADVRDRRDLPTGDRAGGFERGQGGGLAGEEGLRLRHAQHDRRDAAVGDLRVGDGAVGESQAE